MSNLRVTSLRGRTSGKSPELPDGAVVTGVITATSGSFTGNVSVGGTLTYEDVTNIDSVGVITARQGIVVTGISTFNDDIKGDSATNISGINSVTATTYYGSGVNLTGIDATALKFGGAVKAQANADGVVVTGILTATSFKGDGSQLSNIEAGSANFVASGNIHNGATVVINTDGTVGIVTASGSPNPIISEASIFSPGGTGGASGVEYTVTLYDPVNKKIVVAYMDQGDANKGKAVVGTVVGTGITFGSAVTFSGTSAATNMSGVYDPDEGKVVLAFAEWGSGYGKAVVGTVSGDSITFGSMSSSFSDTSNVEGTTTIYDTTNNKVVIAYKRVSSNEGTAVVGTVSGNSITFGSEVLVAANSEYFSATFDPDQEKVVLFYYDGSNAKAVVGTVSENSITFGTAVQFNSGYNYYFSGVYDTTNNKVVVAWTDPGGSGNGISVVGTVSGTSISFGTNVVFHANANTPHIATAFDSVNGKVVINYGDQSSGANNACTGVVGTVSGTNISFGAESVIDFTNSNSGNNDYISCAYDSTNGKVITSFAFHYSGTYDDGRSVVTTVSGTDLFAASSKVFNKASTKHIASTYDTVSNKVVIVYQDNPNSHYGTAIVGTVANDTISFGSEVVFNSGDSNNISCAFDSVNEKVLIAYRAAGGVGKAVVGTVSGSSISFGSESEFESGAIQYTSTVFDSVNGKFVISYKDSDDGNKGKSVVADISGGGISYGAIAEFNSASTDYISSTYDVVNGKVVVAYQDTGYSNYGRAVVGTIDGTTITFGTEVDFKTAAISNTAITSINGKVIIAFIDSAAGSNKCKAIVGTVSGSSITFGSEVLLNSNQCNYPQVIVDTQSTAIGGGDVITIVEEDSTDDCIKLHVGKVIGSTLSFGSTNVVSDTYSNNMYLSLVYDPDNIQSVLSYSDVLGNLYWGRSLVLKSNTISANLTSENYIGIAAEAISNGATGKVNIVGGVNSAQTGLTTARTHYLLNDGSLSTTSADPVVVAGTAISDTKIIVKG